MTSGGNLPLPGSALEYRWYRTAEKRIHPGNYGCLFRNFSRAFRRPASRYLDRSGWNFVVVSRCHEHALSGLRTIRSGGMFGHRHLVAGDGADISHPAPARRRYPLPPLRQPVAFLLIAVGGRSFCTRRYGYFAIPEPVSGSSRPEPPYGSRLSLRPVRSPPPSSAFGSGRGPASLAHSARCFRRSTCEWLSL